MRFRFWRLGIGTALALTAAQGGQATTLDRVLGLVSAMGPSPLSGLFVNMAETIGTTIDTPRTLRAGDQVIVGYANDGSPVLAQADRSGVTVTPEMQAAMTSGLSAGLYPPGSALYALPPAGQLSLFEEAQDAQELAFARELMMTRIDGSVHEVLSGIVPSEMAAIYVIAPEIRLGGVMGRVETTVLGAVNTGEIVTSLAVGVDAASGYGAQVDLAMAGISVGANQALDRAIAESSRASSFRMTQLGGSADVPVAMLNMASAAQDITGAVEMQLTARGLAGGDTVTTVLGAVNAGLMRLVAQSR